jgi:hypothetical protein
MRDWRKLHAVVRESEKLAACTFEARWLWVLLLSAQDDSGRFPWTPAKVRGLTVGTDWSAESCLSHASVLAEHGLLHFTDEGFVELAKGEQYNGTPSNARNPLHYELEPRAVLTQPELSQDSVSTVLEESREEESREEEIQTPSYDGVYLKAFSVLRAIKAWPLGREQVAHEWLVRDEVSEEHAYKAAMALKSQYKSTKHKDLVATLVGWGNNEKKWEAERGNGNARANTTAGRTTDGWREWFPANGGGDSP